MKRSKRTTRAVGGKRKAVKAAAVPARTPRAVRFPPPSHVQRALGDVRDKARVWLGRLPVAAPDVRRWLAAHDLGPMAATVRALGPSWTAVTITLPKRLDRAAFRSTMGRLGADPAFDIRRFVPK